jgi:dCTP diphosphatase
LTANDFNTLRDRLKAFAQERDWEQFHSPKNLAMALIVEAAELLEHFQWLTLEQSESLSGDKRREVELEMADIFIYLMRLSERLDVDLLEVVEDKIKMNEEKYPADVVRGSAKKYSEY